TNPGASAAAVASTGDTFQIRNFAATDRALLTSIIRQGATEGLVQLLSPLLHDNVRGITFTPSETPTAVLKGRRLSQPLKAQDLLAINIGGGAAEVDAGAFTVFYTNLPGAAARLHMWSDIAALIKNVKPLEVDFNTNAVGGIWTDTVITTTESLLHANTDYACLGYITDVAVCAFGLKGTDTGNLRVCGPGVLRSEVTSDYFAKLSDETGMPTIPVINAANAGNTFASCLAVAAAAAVKGQLILAELSQNLPN
ncbi:MAG: hypothetical protein WBD73_17610, partial [Candidatus Acidiferrales bacterium]